MMGVSRRDSLRQRRLARKPRVLKIKHDWKMLVVIFIISIIGCIIGAYVGLNYPD